MISDSDLIRQEEGQVSAGNATEHILGLDRILDSIGRLCVSPMGQEQIAALSFSPDYETIQESLDALSEMMSLLFDSDNPFPFGDVVDLREPLGRIRVRGMWLEVTELVGLRRSLQTLTTVLSYLTSLPEGAAPTLRRRATDITVAPEILRRINALVSDFGTMRDDASTELSRIRSEQVALQARLTRLLDSVLRRAQADGIVPPDSQPTLREGRLVLPVIPAMRRRMPGIVHDESRAGRTLFVEPQEVVENNNRMRQLASEEQREIIRILVEFTEFLRPYLHLLSVAFDFLAYMDSVRAKALWAHQHDAVVPLLHKTCDFRLIKARHPLLQQALQRQGREVVPLDISLNNTHRIMLVSGPNAGGKSVVLKTVGLLQLMVQCGLAVTLSPDSEMGVFSNLMIDIGDSQSIEDSLSTYSSHLLNMKRMLREGRESSLVLIDEMGSGTEPQIGGAIAEAILDQLCRQKVFGIVTTHYANLKHYATDAEGIVNAAMLYDRGALRPLFQLQVGQPGSSFALEIARKTGLPDEVISYATQRAGEENVNYDRHVQEASRDKRYWANKRQQIRLRDKHMASVEQQLMDELSAVSNQRKEILRKAKQEAMEILSSANARIEKAVREIRESAAEKERTRQARRSVDELKHRIQHDSNDTPVERRLRQLKKQQRPAQQPESTPRSDAPVSVGDYVSLRSDDAVQSSNVGTVIELKGTKAVVAFGDLRSVVALTKLQRVSNTQARKIARHKPPIGATPADAIRERKLHFSSQLDIRGYHADEALPVLTMFLDDAVMVGAGKVRILHGTGTGALRELVRQYLSSAHGIADYYDEDVRLGGNGITVVELQ